LKLSGLSFRVSAGRRYPEKSFLKIEKLSKIKKLSENRKFSKNNP
jgi:hypothetical protein